MKFAVVASLISGALALPATSTGVSKRQSNVALVDQLMFGITLPAFTARRGTPASLDWTSDGCTSSPDNPFGYPFVPACQRHDFGYHNFRAQSRFTESNKLRIDNKFREDLNFQCNSVSFTPPCRALAEVYYAAVRAFGGGDATPGMRVAVNDELVREYEEKVALYEAAVKDAQEKGELPILDE